MSHGKTIPLSPQLIELGSRDFAAISNWPYADTFVARLLRDDIPQRVQFSNCRIWVYRDPEGRLVGFGTLDMCDECREFTRDQNHPYIPLLAVNPTIKSQGYGTSIVRHLLDEAALVVQQSRCHDVLFLDVYSSNSRAISLYSRSGFSMITPQPIADRQEGGQTYVVMAKRVSVG